MFQTMFHPKRGALESCVIDFDDHDICSQTVCTIPNKKKIPNIPRLNLPNGHNER